MQRFRSIMLSAFTTLSLLAFGSACRHTNANEDSDLREGGAMVGISTEHPIEGVSQTACGFSRDAVMAMHTAGYYYVAAPEVLFQGGKNCGRIIEIDVGGACYENHSANCTTPAGHASLEQFRTATQQTPPAHTARFFIADLCASCLNNAATPHLDITDRVYQAGSPLGALRSYLERNIQAVKQAGTSKTAQPNNLFLQSITLGACAPIPRLASWVGGGQAQCPGN